MKLSAIYSLHHGDAEWQRRDLFDWVTDLFEVPSIVIEPGCTTRVRAHLQHELTNAGWAYDVRINPEHDITVTGTFRDVAFQIQTGNISRAIYDLMKLEYLYQTRRIGAAALAVPSKQAADLIASNVANADRLWGEIRLFDRIITTPLLLVAFE